MKKEYYNEMDYLDGITDNSSQLMKKENNLNEINNTIFEESEYSKVTQNSYPK